MSLVLGALLLALAPGSLADESKPIKFPAVCAKKGKARDLAACTDVFIKKCKKADRGENEKVCQRIFDSMITGERKCKGGNVLGTARCRLGKALDPITDPISDTVDDVDGFVRNPVDTVASAAFDAVAGKFGKAASDILSDLTEEFLKVSHIDLASTGINGKDPDKVKGDEKKGNKFGVEFGVYQMTWGLSALVALLLLIWQFTKVGYSGEGKAAATAITGLAKWAVVCVAALAVTQAALGVADEISRWLIDTYNDGGGRQDFSEKLNEIFKFGGWRNTALILLFGILAALTSLILWGEMLLRQAAVVVLVACLPIVAAGSIMDATKEWWPKARNALISLILIKPVVVLIFVIGFSTTGKSSSVKDFMVGLLTIVLAAFAWPALAKFMTFTSVGAGGGLASGLLGAAGGTAGSMFYGGGGAPSGAGAVGGGRAFTQALQSENDSTVAQAGAGGGAGGRAGGFAGMGKLGAAAMALQGAKAGKEMLEGGMEAMAAHADLGPGKDMGGQINIPPSGGAGGGADGTQQQPPPPPPPGPDGPPAPRTPLEPGLAPAAIERTDGLPAVDGKPEVPSITAAPVRPALPPAPRAVDGSEG